jgi:hypothetical protein
MGLFLAKVPRCKSCLTRETILFLPHIAERDEILDVVGNRIRWGQWVFSVGACGGVDELMGVIVRTGSWS